jgi:hypothetical protein
MSSFAPRSSCRVGLIKGKVPILRIRQLFPDEFFTWAAGPKPRCTRINFNFTCSGFSFRRQSRTRHATVMETGWGLAKFFTAANTVHTTPPTSVRSTGQSSSCAAPRGTCDEFARSLPTIVVHICVGPPLLEVALPIPPAFPPTTVDIWWLDYNPARA